MKYRAEFWMRPKEKIICGELITNSRNGGENCAEIVAMALPPTAGKMD
jgi:hypothetical protein